MPDVLFTVLGGVGRAGDGRYREANYCFPDGSVRGSTYFAKALLDHLHAQQRTVNKLVVMGTDASMWDELVRVLMPEGEERDGLRNELFALALDRKIDQTLVDRLRPMVSEALGTVFDPVLIPYCEKEDQILKLVALLSSKVEDGNEVMFDITHGLRHLPLIGLVSAILIQSLRKVRVSAVWYGAFDMPTAVGHAPVLNLAGVLDLVKWLRGLSAYDASGDLKHLAPVLQKELGRNPANDMKRASFLEQTLRFSEARDAARRVRVSAEQLQGPVATLFRGEMFDRLRWCTREDLADAQYELAREHLYRGNLQAGSIVAHEAVLTWLIVDPSSPVASGADPTSRKARKETHDKAVDAICDEGYGSFGRAYHDIRMIRNWLAHGEPPTRRHIREIQDDPDRLPKLLRSALDTIFKPG